MLDGLSIKDNCNPSPGWSTRITNTNHLGVGGGVLDGLSIKDNCNPSPGWSTRITNANHLGVCVCVWGGGGVLDGLSIKQSSKMMDRQFIKHTAGYIWNAYTKRRRAMYTITQR